MMRVLCLSRSKRARRPRRELIGRLPRTIGSGYCVLRKSTTPPHISWLRSCSYLTILIYMPRRCAYFRLPFIFRAETHVRISTTSCADILSAFIVTSTPCGRNASLRSIGHRNIDNRHFLRRRRRPADIGRQLSLCASFREMRCCRYHSADVTALQYRH